MTVTDGGSLPEEMPESRTLAGDIHDDDAQAMDELFEARPNLTLVPSDVLEIGVSPPEPVRPNRQTFIRSSRWALSTSDGAPGLPVMLAPADPCRKMLRIEATHPIRIASEKTDVYAAAVLKADSPTDVVSVHTGALWAEALDNTSGAGGDGSQVYVDVWAVTE